MPDIHYTNYHLKDDTEYFIYIGELKNYGLNIFLREALARIHDRPFDFITICPDVFEQYSYDNLIVINPLVATGVCRPGNGFSCRVPAPEFMTAVSQNAHVRELVRRLSARQGGLYLYMYESLPEMTLDALPGVTILGPDSGVARRMNSKINQYRQLSGRLPLPDFQVCHGVHGLLAAAAPLWKKWSHGIVVTREFSAAGVNSIVATRPGDIVERFGDLEEDMLMSRFVPHHSDPTVLAVVAGEEDIYIAGIADQCIEGGTRFTGSCFPSAAPESVREELIRHTREAGRWLAAEGYRGIFGCDYIVTDDGGVYFLEINARKQGTTLEFCCTLEQSLPTGAPMLPELEYHAVVEERLPATAVELAGNPKNLHWGTHNYKIHRTVRTNGYIPQSNHEREAYRRVADGRLMKDFLILEHIGSDFVVTGGSFIARIVALGHDQDSVAQGLLQGRKTIELTINDATEEETLHG
jgi:predicted ATP-grasp superfamily ATP-dependent carboligase